MWQNARVTAFTVSELLRENQQGGGRGKITPPTPRLDLSYYKKKITTYHGYIKIHGP